MSLLADTGGLYALFDADDRHHEDVRRIVESEASHVIVPAAILGELDYLLREHLGIEAEISLLDNLLDGGLTLDLPPFEDLRRVRELIDRYRDLDIGFADASVIATAERLDIERILTLDERDFRAVEPAIDRPLVILPADA